MGKVVEVWEIQILERFGEEEGKPTGLRNYFLKI
jgi:hypothetical protein